MAVPRVDGKMNASEAVSLLADLHHSSSVSMETGSQTLAQVRHGTIDFNDFEALDRSKFCVCNLQF
jgi:hypothetical protein